MVEFLVVLIALVLGIAYLVYSVQYWGGVTEGASSDSEAIGAGIASMLVMPHLVMTALAVVFNALAFLLYNRPFILVAGILYTVALVLFPTYFMFVIAQMIICYIAFARMKKEKNS